ncbi:DUF2971 domain-containing protein [Pseudomonas sp. R2.Fl]|nr:DUF2971 domain-containing protein [Pseudomonas sp. R2.Fl]
MIVNFSNRLSIVPPGWNDRLHFFKYMSVSTAKIVLENRTLRWSSPKKLNDPFDIQFNMEIEADPSKVKERALELLWQVHQGKLNPNPDNPLGAVFGLLRYHKIPLSRNDIVKEFGPAFDEGFSRMLAKLPEIHAEAARIIEDNKILCLTTRPDNTLMWAHYAEAHQGIVLRFRSIPALNTPYGMAKPVNYVEKVPVLLDEEQLAGVFSGVFSLKEAGILDRTIYTKSKHWQYEDEWRLSAGAGRNPGADFEDCPFGQNELDGIIFGLRTSDEDRAQIRAFAKPYPNVQWMHVQREPASFDLRILEMV